MPFQAKTCILVHDLLLQAFRQGIDESTLLSLLHWYQTIISNEKWSWLYSFCSRPESGAFPMNASITLMLEILDEPSHMVPVLSVCTSILVSLASGQRRPSGSLSHSSRCVAGGDYTTDKPARSSPHDRQPHGRYRRQQLAGHSDGRAAEGADDGGGNRRCCGVCGAETRLLHELLQHSPIAVLRLRWIVSCQLSLRRGEVITSSFFHCEGMELGGGLISTSRNAQRPHAALSVLRFSQEGCAQW